MFHFFLSRVCFWYRIYEILTCVSSVCRLWFRKTAQGESIFDELGLVKGYATWCVCLWMLNSWVLWKTSINRIFWLLFKVYFEPEDVYACIVTCGGLCPGLNTVIREIVCGLSYMYGVKKIVGIQVIIIYLGFICHRIVSLEPLYSSQDYCFCLCFMIFDNDLLDDEAVGYHIWSLAWHSVDCTPVGMVNYTSIYVFSSLYMDDMLLHEFFVNFMPCLFLVDR